MDLLAELDRGCLCADGAMGTELFARGMPREACLEELCLRQPDLVLSIHEDYLRAGARLIRTHSFGANAGCLARHGLENRVNEINWQAAQLACQAARGHDVVVVGSVGPVPEDAGEAADHFQTQIGALLDGGAQAIMLETFQNIDQLLVALEVKHSLHHCPVICSLTPESSGRLPDGTSLHDAWARLIANDADLVGINCVDGPRTAVDLLAGLPETPVAAFPNAGNESTVPPDAFARAGLELASRGVRLLGGCCGTTPAHIAALAAALTPPE